MNSEHLSTMVDVLPIEKLVAAPLIAAADAQIELYRKTVEFIDEISIGENGKIKSIDLNYINKMLNIDGDVIEEDCTISLPILAVTGAPFLAVDEVDIDFELAVNAATETVNEARSELSAGASIPMTKLNVTASLVGNVSGSRTTDTRARYSFRVIARRLEMPEALSRVIDHIANAQAKPSFDIHS